MAVPHDRRLWEDRDRPSSEIVRQFRTLVENIPGLVAYMDLVRPDDPGSSTPVYISPQIEEMLGYPRESWLNDDELWLDVLHPEDAERMIAADAEARRTLSSLFAEYRMVARDRSVVWVSEKAAVVRDDATGAFYWQGVMVDITERKRAEDALAASERQYRSIFDAAAIGVMTLDLDGLMLDVNATLEQVCEYPAGTLQGRPFREYLDPGDHVSVARLADLSAGLLDRCRLEHRFRRNDGSLMWCRTVMVLVRDGDGRPDHITAMLEDIGDRKQAEAELLHRTLHDPLTELPNRQLFLERLRAARARRLVGAGLAVIFMDVDRFKDVNDTLGHHAGDDLLVAFAGRLTEAVRPSDVVARFAGDEFLVLADEVGSPAAAAQLGARLIERLRRPFAIGGETLSVTASLGVAYSADPADLPEEILRRADAAMYLAKQRGRNRAEMFGEEDATGGRM